MLATFSKKNQLDASETGIFKALSNWVKKMTNFLKNHSFMTFSKRHDRSCMIAHIVA